jgi:hypothetical protein
LSDRQRRVSSRPSRVWVEVVCFLFFILRQDAWYSALDRAHSLVDM